VLELPVDFGSGEVAAEGGVGDLVATCRIFGWVEPTGLDELLASLASLATGGERPDQVGG
jgi:hypothetical protein